MKPWQSLLHYLPVIIILMIGAVTLGYGIGANLLTPSSQVTTTITTTTSVTTKATTTTATETSFSTTSIIVTTTKTQTYTTTVTSTATLIPQSGSTIATFQRTVGNNNSTILFTLSIDKPSYHLGETMHIKGSVTNLSPTTNVTLTLGEYQIYVFNSTGGEVWTSPIGFYDGLDNLRPMYTREYTLTPLEELKLDYTTTEWNFTGLEVTPKVTARYTGILVPEGTYTIEWSPLFGADLGQLAQITRVPIKINFTITPTTATITTTTTTATTPQTKTYSTTITETVNRTDTITVTTTSTYQRPSPLSLGEPEVRDAYNQTKISVVHVNSTVLVGVAVNNYNFTNSGLLFIQVKDVNGNMVAMSLTHINLQPYENVTLDTTWMPLKKGTYDISAGFEYDPPLPLNVPITRLKVEVV